MNNELKVSVVMSIYKERVEWLQQSIDSVLSQTMKCLELIIVCDNPGYSEGISLLNRYSELDSRVKVILNIQNIGLTRSLNKGIQNAQGKYIARLDADDVALPNRLEKQVDFMEKNPRVVASGTAAYYWYDDGLKRTCRRTKNIDLRSLLMFDSPIYHPSAIFKRIIDGEIVQYNEDFKYSQDYALWISLIKSHELSNINKPLIKYRVSDQQISTSKHEEQREFALRNQIYALQLLNINLDDNEITLFQDLTRKVENKHERKEVQDFILNFMAKLKNRKDINLIIIANHWLLIYVNLVAKELDIFMGFYDYFKLCIKMRHFSLYSLLSLLSKYLK